MDCGSTIFIFLALIQAICGQTVTGPSAVQQGSDTVYTCTGVTPTGTFTWTDLSADPSVLIFTGAERSHAPAETKYDNFNVLVSENEGTSTMTISNTAIEDEGLYRCIEGQGRDDAELKVEVKGTWSVSPEILVKSNINDTFEATCEAVGGRPNETITWMLGDGPSPCDDTDVTYPAAGSGLFSTTSICTFQATSEKNGKTLKCLIGGHEVSGLNGEETTTLETHTSPLAFGTTVSVDYVTQGTGIIIVSCTAENEPTPAMRNYYIYSNGTLKHESTEGGNKVTVSDPEEGTNYTCMAGNYLGNTPLSEAETYDPKSPEDANIGAIIGGVVGAIVVIVIIVIAVCYCKKEERYCFEAGGPKSSGSSKPAGSAVGSSNGSERDVESPLNGVKDVTAEEKTRPEAAPRGHGSIQHTNDNPNQDMYAMVDKKKPTGGGGGGDVPDRGSGPGQNEPQGMLYADLDLSHKAGHHDKHVPKNENDVVVYSSILV